MVGVRGETHRSLLDDVQDGDGELRIREGVRLGVDLGHFLELLGSGGGAEVSDRSGIERKEGFGARPPWIVRTRRWKTRAHLVLVAL